MLDHEGVPLIQQPLELRVRSILEPVAEVDDGGESGGRVAYGLILSCRIG